MKPDVLSYCCLFTFVFRRKALMLLPGMAFLDSGCCLRQYWSGLAENLIQTEFLLNAEKRQVGGDTHTHTHNPRPLQTTTAGGVSLKWEMGKNIRMATCLQRGGCSGGRCLDSWFFHPFCKAK